MLTKTDHENRVNVCEGYQSQPPARSRVGWTEADALDGDSTGAVVAYYCDHPHSEMIRVSVTEEP